MSELIHSLGIDWHILVAQMINFAILFAVLLKFVYKPVIKLLDDRRAGVLVALKNEEKATASLAAADSDREKILAQARLDSVALLEASKRDADEMKKKMLIAAKEEVAKMHVESEKRLREERARLITEVKGEVGSLLVSTIEQTLGDVLDARTQGKMVEQALSAIREGSKKSSV